MTTSGEPRVVLIGGVESTAVTLEELLAAKVQVAGVAGLAQPVRTIVSGYADLSATARTAGIPFLSFQNVREASVAAHVRQWAPTHLFVVGLSQLVDDELLRIPPGGAIGFHPTALPKGRGRAPLAWLTGDGAGGAATFFMLDAGVDSGPIVAQEPFEIPRGAHAAEVAEAMYAAMRTALRRMLPELARARELGVAQDERQATYFGRRAPEDGWIDWEADAASIERLVRMSSRPHPGAFTYLNESKLTIWRAKESGRADHRGVVGRVLAMDGGGFLVQTGSGLIEVLEWECDGGRPADLRVGTRLGLPLESEVVALRRRVAALEQALQQLLPSQAKS